MTLPMGPPMSTLQIATEMGVSHSGFQLNSPASRAFAGVPSGPIRMKDFYGKSATMSASIGSSQSGSGTSSSNTFTLTATPTGGTGPYAYAWTISGVSSGTAVFAGSSAVQTVFVDLTTAGGLGSNVSCSVQCTVHDSAGHVCTSNIATLSWTFT